MARLHRHPFPATAVSSAAIRRRRPAAALTKRFLSVFVFWRRFVQRGAFMVEAVRRNGSTAKDRPALSQASDAVIASGLSVHVFGGTVGIYSERIESGRGFAEFPVADLLALIRFFALPESRKLLDLPD